MAAEDQIELAQSPDANAPAEDNLHQYRAPAAEPMAGRIDTSSAAVPESTVTANAIYFQGDGEHSEVSAAGGVPQQQGLGFEFPTNPYEHVPQERQKELNKLTEDLIGSVTGNEVTHQIMTDFGPQEYTTKDNRINYREYGQLLNDIAKRDDLTEMEKLYVWTHLNSLNGDKYKSSTEGANPAVVDSIMPWDTGHCILNGGARDQYHGQMANMTPEEADARIMENERNEGWKTSFVHGMARKVIGIVTGVGDINSGDYHSSTHQATALRAMKAEGFSGYAREWNRLFVQN
jgi:hypothetical protein